MNKSRNLDFKPISTTNTKTQQKTQAQTISITEIRPIKPTDTFPCFSCFDQPQAKLKCQACGKKGFVTGDHPMVRFVDDFLSKNLMAYVDAQEGFSGDISDSQGSYQGFKNTFGNRATTRKECQSALQSYSTREPEPEVGCNLVKSSKPSDNCSVHVVFGCNMCQIEPIRGNRYHCQECKDFDLCQKCHNQIQQNNGSFEGHQWFHKFEVIGQTKSRQFMEKLGVRLSNPGNRKK